MADIDWTTFTTRISISCDPAALYHAWATRKGIEHWFLRMSEYRTPDGRLRQNDELVQPGDTYHWRWHGWPDETEEKGTILECNGKDHFKFTFGQAGICTVSIKREEGLPVVELVQTDIPDDDHGRQYWHVGCKTGWTFYFANLKSLMEGGIDLRNKNEALKNVINS
jgi:uncharacterized protein YndB with AHSA1/START domain